MKYIEIKNCEGCQYFEYCEDYNSFVCTINDYHVDVGCPDVLTSIFEQCPLPSGKIILKTSIENDKIEIETKNTIDSLIYSSYKDVLDLKEKAIKEALIKLGWTPPKEKI